MSVWLNEVSAGPSLVGSEGELLAVSIAVEPQRLESLLEALAHVSFPINPRIRHGALSAVDFPAYQNRMAEVHRVLVVYGFDPEQVQTMPMLKQIHTARAAAGE